MLILNDSIAKYKEIQDVQLSNFNSERLGLNSQIENLKNNNTQLSEQNNELIKKSKTIK